MSAYDDLSGAPDEMLWSRLGDAEGLARADVLIELGRRASENREWVRAVALLDEAASVAEEVDDLRLAAHALSSKGGLRFGMGDYSESAAAYLRAADHLRSIGRLGDQAAALWGRADALRAAGDFESAIDSALGCRALAEAEEFPELAGDACYVLATAYYYLDREDESLRACADGRDLYRSVGVTAKVAQIDDFALTVRLFLGHLDEALALARNCYVLALTTSTPDDDAYATRRLADVHLRRGELPAAFDRAGEARELYREAGFLPGVARSEVIQARVLRSEGELTKAVDLYTGASVLFDSSGADEEARSCDSSRAVLLHSLGQFREAAAVNRRLIEVLSGHADPLHSDLPWAVGRLADDLLAVDDAAGAVDLLGEWMWLWDSEDEAGRASHRYVLSTAAEALAATGRAEEAADIAGAALELTNEEDISSRTAVMYELRARWLLEAGDDRGRQALAHSIALHLAFGWTDRAAELSSYFLPEVRDRHDRTTELEWDLSQPDVRAA